MGILMFAQDPAAKHWWFVFVDHWGNTMTFAGLILTLIAFPVTWRMQAKIRSETQKAVGRIAWMVLRDAMEQMNSHLLMAKESARLVMWQRAFDACEAARQCALRSIGNPHLTEAEKTEMRAHADNLYQVTQYIERNKLVPNPPQVFQQDKKAVLDAMQTFVVTIQVRLNQTFWGA
jgi:hypothetical protein